MHKASSGPSAAQAVRLAASQRRACCPGPEPGSLSRLSAFFLNMSRTLLPDGRPQAGVFGNLGGLFLQ
ncbi:MAG: hypothetical protein LBT40_00240 [Deltaproteobacteria bacterium]|nr:hypothetical protein [Deltaproteobacteria bacterium]